MPVRMAWGIVATLAGCGADVYEELDPANAALSSEFLDFGTLAPEESVLRTLTVTNTGELKLGIASVRLASSESEDFGHTGAFTVDWDGPDTDLPDTDLDTDTDTDLPEPEDTEDTATDTDSEGAWVVLAPGESLAVPIWFTPAVVGDNYDAVWVETVEIDAGNDVAADEKVYADRDTQTAVAYLHGTSTGVGPDALVSPFNLSFGYAWPGEQVQRVISISNAGGAALTILNFSVSEACDPAFSVLASPAAGTVLEPGAATVVELLFSPTTENPASCVVTVETDDPADPSQTVAVSANSGGQAGNQPPLVQIHSPAPGYVHAGWGPVHMELTVNDPDQPASTLTCRVRSAYQLGSALANCNPTDATGYVSLDVPVDSVLEAGSDVLLVQVSDDFGALHRVSIPVLINAGYPESDDDGDGFADELDCDDNNIASYPQAAELHDHEDNDCDGRIDEQTEGADDDGDGVSEFEGDCDDAFSATYPSAPERQDGADNDCDGIVDELTDAYDDDGDGFSELDRDCDDFDAEINPSAVELCSDEIDNNCNGRKDQQEQCSAIDSLPMIVGGILLEHSDIEVGDAVRMTALIHEADGDPITHQWTVEDGAGVLDDLTSFSVTWTAPEELPEGQLVTYRISYIGADDDGHQVWAFADVRVHAANKLRSPVPRSVDPGTGCVHVPLGGIGAVLAAAMIRRRRRIVK